MGNLVGSRGHVGQLAQDVAAFGDVSDASRQAHSGRRPLPQIARRCLTSRHAGIVRGGAGCDAAGWCQSVSLPHRDETPVNAVEFIVNSKKVGT